MIVERPVTILAKRDGEQVGFGARVGEPHALMTEPVADQFGEADLEGVHSTDAGVVGQRIGHGGVHTLLGMAEQAGGVVADEVDVAVPVGIDQRAAVTFDERQRKRRVMQDRARASTWKHGAGTFVLLTRGGVAVGGVAAQPVHDCHKSTLCGH